MMAEAMVASIRPIVAAMITIVNPIATPPSLTILIVLPGCFRGSGDDDRRRVVLGEQGYASMAFVYTCRPEENRVWWSERTMRTRFPFLLPPPLHFVSHPTPPMLKGRQKGGGRKATHAIVSVL